MTLLLKDPSAVLDYAIDWRADYLAESEMLSQSAWSVTPTEQGGLAIVGHDFDAATSTVKVSGGVEGHVYRLENRISTLLGRTDARSITLRVEKR